MASASKASSAIAVSARASRGHHQIISDDEHGVDTGSGGGAITRVDFQQAMEAAEERQSRGIRYEFFLQGSRIDTKLEEHQSTLSGVQREVNELRREVKGHGQELQGHSEELKKHGQRLDNLAQRVDALHRASDAHNRISNAKEINRGATHLYNNIVPVGKRDEASETLVEPQRFPARVGTFWRLKKRSGWGDLVRLHRFYETSTWHEWGIGLLDDESDDDDAPLEPAHKTLEDAVHYAPEIALHQLAQHIGLDYDKIALNAEEDQRNHESRTTRAKRPTAAPQTTTVAKRPNLRSLSPIPHSELVGKFTPTPPARRSKTPSTKLGWAQPSDRSGDESRPHRASPSPTSVATTAM